MFITKSYQAQFLSIFTFLTKKVKITILQLCHIIALLLHLPGYKKRNLYNHIKKIARYVHQAIFLKQLKVANITPKLCAIHYHLQY